MGNRQSENLTRSDAERMSVYAYRAAAAETILHALCDELNRRDPEGRDASDPARVRAIVGRWVKIGTAVAEVDKERRAAALSLVRGA